MTERSPIATQEAPKLLFVLDSVEGISFSTEIERLIGKLREKTAEEHSYVPPVGPFVNISSDTLSKSWSWLDTRNPELLAQASLCFSVDMPEPTRLSMRIITRINEQESADPLDWSITQKEEAWKYNEFKESYDIREKMGFLITEGLEQSWDDMKDMEMIISALRKKRHT